MCCMLFCFFSSRRRHTRWPRDWSSDVCSSDLDFVINQNPRYLAGTDIIEHLVDLKDLFVALRAGRIHHMEQQIGMNSFLEGCFKSSNECGWQITNKPYRV